MSFETDGERTIYLKHDINSFMSRRSCLNHEQYYDFFSKYMMKDYKNFISVRRKEVNVHWLWKHFNISFSFTKDEKNYKDWRNLKKTLSQSEFFLSNLDVNYNRFQHHSQYNTYSIYNLTKYDFNALKKLWKPYIEHIHNEKIKNDPTYLIAIKLGNF